MTPDYQVPFAFTGKLDLRRATHVDAEDEKNLSKAYRATHGGMPRAQKTSTSATLYHST
jgi:hypothetical protein